MLIIFSQVRPSSMEAPSPGTPVVAVSIGSGLAPFMSFLHDRIAAQDAGEQVAGPLTPPPHPSLSHIYKAVLSLYPRSADT